MYEYESYSIDYALDGLALDMATQLEAGVVPDSFMPTETDADPDHYLQNAKRIASQIEEAPHTIRFQTYPKHAPEELAAFMEDWEEENQDRLSEGDFDTPRWELVVDLDGDGHVDDLEFVATVGWQNE